MAEDSKIAADDIDDLAVANYVEDIEDWHEEEQVHTKPYKSGKKE